MYRDERLSMGRRPSAPRWLLAIAVLLGAASTLLAQERFGAIAGVVRDESGGVLPGAAVVITNLSTDRTVNLVTDRVGAYRVNDLEPGHYRVRFELDGFARTEKPDVAVLLGKTLEVDATMNVGSVSEAVQVTAEAVPLVDMRATTVAHNVTAEEFDLLPKTRSFQSLAITSPSVNTGVIEGGMQVNGASGAENAFTIDGVVTSSLYNGRSRQDTAFEYVQEVQVKTTGIPAEYGGAMGGVISAVTKSGGNSVHGEAHYYYEGNGISAGPVKRLVLSSIDDKTVNYAQDKKQPDNRNEVGGSLGGPIVRDKLFFFGSVSPRLVRKTNTYLFSNGAEQGGIKQKQTLMQAFGKISYASSRVNAYGSVLFTPIDSVGTLPAYNGTMPNGISSSMAGNSANQNRGYNSNQTNVTGNVDITLSNSSFLTVRGGYFYDNYEDTGIPSTTSVSYQTSSVGYSAIPPSLQGPIGTQNTPRAIITSFDTTTRGFVSADYNHAFTAKGWHTVKGGIGFQHSLSDANAAYPGGYVLLYWNRTFSFAETSGRGAYGYYEVNDRGFKGTAGANMASLFLQDEWSVSNRLMLSLGVRAETEKIPTYRPDLKKYVLDFGLGDKISPRLGASYDVTGDGRVKVYGSWGRYYDWTKYQLERNALGSDFWKTYYRSLDTLDINSLSLSNMPGTDLWVTPGSYRDQAVPGLDKIDPLTKPTYQDSTSIGLEHQLGANSVFSAHYVHNDFRRVIEDVGTVVSGNRVLYITNPGEGNAKTMATTGLTAPFPTPKVKRVYDAIELGVSRRLSNKWFASANYTYSRLYGNYGGLASSDEIRTPTTGGSYLTPQAQDRSIANPGGALRTYWNIDEVMWDSHGNLDILGRLATDRPHVVKLYGAYSFPFGTQVGLFFYGGSGTPISTYVNTTNQTEVFVNGRGDMGRTPVLTQTNLLVSHGIALGDSKRLRVELNVLNLFNQKTATHLFNYLNRGGGAVPRASSAINLSQTNLASGYDYNALIRATSDGANAYDPRYGMADLLNDGARGQILVKLVF
jgi:hypothetical protein